MVGAILGAILFIEAPRILRKIGGLKFFFLFLIGEIVALIGLAVSENPLFIIPLFTFHQVAVFMIAFSLDIFLEIANKDEGGTGLLRGTFMTYANLALIISPAIVGILVFENSYWKVYILSALLLIPSIFVAKKFLKEIENPKFEHLDLKTTFFELREDLDLVRIVIVNFILQVFYAWMTIYTPIYLHERMGIPWYSIGLIFTIMLLPFVLFEIPAGKLADRKTGEKEIIVFGIIVMAGATSLIPFIGSSVFIVWAGVLFLTRIGASLVEVGTESYFFKKVGGDDSNLIGFFRITRPLSFILGPALAIPALYILGFKDSFFVLSALVLSSLLIMWKLKDTR